MEQLDTDGSAEVLLEEIQKLKESVSKKAVKRKKKPKKTSKEGLRMVAEKGAVYKKKKNIDK
nr:hypothetical protein [uncultured Psychroserpens sp.]